jgi:biotin transport system permease protein
MGEIRKTLGRLEKRLHIKGRAFSLGFSLMLGFLPRFFEVWESADLAWQARAGRNSLRKLVFIIPFVLESMMEEAAGTAMALQARGL